MNQEEAIKNVYNALLSETSIPVSIRNMEGVDKVQYEELKKNIIFLIDYYKDRDNVPKKLALAFVDISNYFFVPNLNYSEEDSERFEDYGIELSELANKLFDDE
ncbi:hypothetical protein FLACOL_00241 [Flavobacterium columnare]|uniref:Uncharacterized protein n=2 Tax=Flavobacterium TaxID=237 RepID=A0ABW8PSH1_9FLAO|nr:hypothetical protein [Flavobacterium columnare]SPE76263.1 hypothetical protein FLACOL_00241 [Flavobacterium columnare]